MVVAEIAAAVMERREGRLRLAEEARRRLIIARPAALAELGEDVEGYETIALPDVEPIHPVQDFQMARAIVDAERARLEVELGQRYRRHAPGWLVVDGPIGGSSGWASDPRLIGVSKSHATLPFEGDDLDRYLRLPAGYRTSVFAPAPNAKAPVYSWALRLWPWEGGDLLHGLVRVEVAPTPTMLATADQISRWLLAERAPMSLPDPRWHRFLYGIHQVEAYLKARRPVPAEG